MLPSALLSPRTVILNRADNYLQTAHDRYMQYSKVISHEEEFRMACRKCRYDAALYNHLHLAIIYSILACTTLSQCEAMFLKLHCLVHDDWRSTPILVHVTDILLPDLNQSTEIICFSYRQACFLSCSWTGNSHLWPHAAPQPQDRAFLKNPLLPRVIHKFCPT